MKKGFTLIELLAVITILGALTIITFPIILKQINNARNNVEDATKMLIIDATKDYLDANKDDFPKTNGVKYCIEIAELEDYLLDLKDENLNDIDKSRKVKISYNNQYNFDIVDECPTVTITFDTDGGTLEQTSKKIIKGSVYAKLPTPTKNNAIFIGWYLSDNTTKVNINTIANEDVTLKAHWVGYTEKSDG